MAEFPNAFRIISFFLPLALFIARRIGNDFLPSRKSFPTGFFVIFESPIMPIRSSTI